MKRVLLILPPIQDFYFTFSRNYPLGLLYLATLLIKEGFEAKIVNALEWRRKVTIRIPQNFSYLKRYYHPNKSPFRLFNNFYHFGLTFEEVQNFLKDFKPHIVGISANFSCYFDSAIQVAETVKKVDKRIIVVVGGRCATSRPHMLIKNPSIDFVIRGEAEYTFLELCKKVDKKIEYIPGLCYRVGSKSFISSQVPIIEDLDRLPYPERRLINYDEYKIDGNVYTSLIASRGCNLGCRFCAIKEPFRYRKAENVFGEIEICYNLGIRHFNFEDDNINLNPQFEKLLDLIIDNLVDKGKSIRISFMNGLMSKNLNFSILNKLKKCGLTHVDFSLVTRKKSLIKYLNRCQEKKIFSFSSYLADRNIYPFVHFIVGLPHQKFEECFEDVSFLAGKRVFLGPSIFYPVMESSLFKEISSVYQIREEDYIYFRSSCAYFEKDMKRDEIFFIFYICRVINFIKGVIDKFMLSNHDFLSWVEKTTFSVKLSEGKIVFSEKLDKYTLGAVIIRELLTQEALFRIVLEKKKGVYVYKLIREEFISSQLIKTFLQKVRNICGVKNPSFVQLQGAYSPLQ